MLISKRQRRATGLVVALLFSFGALFSGAVQATDNYAPGNCSHGYWKNHSDIWGVYKYLDFDTLFNVNFFDPDVTLMQAINLKGGGVNAIARDAVAAYLNNDAYGINPTLGEIQAILLEPYAAMMLQTAILNCEGGQGPQGKPGEQGPQGKDGPPGAQGVQGKLGDQGPQGKGGDQGVQGKPGAQGDQGKPGDQGPQGKGGDQGVQGKPGAQGDQGKPGDQGPQGKGGEQGVQGKLGPQGDQGKPGPQGDQGKIGPAGNDGADGAIGPQGKKGETGETGAQGDQGKPGAQGPQGKDGPPGADGDDGAGTFVCFSTDQTIGSQGKYVGLGTQAGSHDRVSIVMPADVIVESFTVKASQGNNPDEGDAWLYRDGQTDEGVQINGPCELTLANPDSKEDTTVCMVTIVDPCATASLPAKDSLSVFIKTDNGSFEGMSACALLRSPAVCD